MKPHLSLSDSEVADALDGLAEHGQPLLALSACSLLRDAARRLRHGTPPVAAPGAQLLLTVKEAMAMTLLSRTTVYGLIDSGEWSVVRVGRAVRIPLANLVTWIDNRRAPK